MRSAWFQSARVGAVSVKGAAELGKQGIVLSDQIIRDLDIPIMQEALDLMDKVFSVADSLGVGDEVRAAVYAIRGAEYASVAAGAILPPAASAAGASALAAIGGVAALGAIAVIGAIVFSLFGGGDDEEKAHKRLKQAQASVLRLRDRLSLASFAAEQDDAAASEHGLALLAGVWSGFGSPSEHAAAALRAERLAAFYRKVQGALSTSERALYESLSNLARWTAVLKAYWDLPSSKRDGVDVMFGKTEPRLPAQLAGPMAVEQERLAGLVTRARSTSSWSALVVLAGVGAAALYVYNPALLVFAWRGAGKAVATGWGAAGRLVSKANPL